MHRFSVKTVVAILAFIWGGGGGNLASSYTIIWSHWSWTPSVEGDEGFIANCRDQRPLMKDNNQICFTIGLFYLFVFSYFAPVEFETYFIVLSDPN